MKSSLLRFGYRYLSSTRQVCGFDGRIPVKNLKRLVKVNDDGVPCVEIRFDIVNADWISEKLRSDFINRYSYRIASNGEMVIESSRTHCEQLNMADCVDKLRSALFQCESEKMNPPDPREVARKNAQSKLIAYK